MKCDEKIHLLKVWSGLELRGYYNNPVRRSMLSRPLTGEPRNDDSTEEDLNMLAFFDLLTTVCSFLCYLNCEIIARFICDIGITCKFLMREG